METIPSLKQINTLVFEPIHESTTYPVKVPYIVSKNISYEVPHIVMVDKVIQTPEETNRLINETIETEVMVNKTYKQPVEQMKQVEVEVPHEIDEVVTIEQAVIEFVKKMRQVPVIEEEIIPDPPCHWHSIEHSHGVEVGNMHKHNM